VTHAIILITAERSALRTLGGELAGLDGVAEAYSVTGDWDFVAVLRVKDHEQIAELVTKKIAALDGVTRTHTMVAFQAFSRFDLEQMFTLGQ
jgi:DNA-binding Lrp family transcriptional regulator